MEKDTIQKEQEFMRLLQEALKQEGRPHQPRGDLGAVWSL